MAKKKVSHYHHQEKPLQKQEDLVKAHSVVTPAMDSEASDKIESLKYLNQMLLKEAVERRQQMDLLVQSKGSLEMELTRSNSEREALESELTQFGERAARLELERSVVAVFVAVQVGLEGEVIERKMKGLDTEVRELKRVIGEKESEIGRLNGKLSEIEGALGNEREISQKVCIERDEIDDKLHEQIEEGQGLREKLIELKERKRVIELEFGELRVAYNAVVGEKEEREMRIESITREKDSIERSLVESNKLIEEMREKIHEIVRGKEVVEEEKNMEMFKRKELENSVSGLNEMVVNLQKEEEKLLANAAVLEKKCSKGEERQKEMMWEIDRLVEEMKLREKRIEELVDEQTVIKNYLSEALKHLAGEKHKIEEMVNEKIVILDAKGRLDSEVGALQNQVAELKAVVLKLEESIQVEVEKVKSLESGVGEYRRELEQAKVERDEMENCLDEEKQNAVRLKEKIGELENKIEESLKAAGETKAKNDAMFAEKIELESWCEMLKKETTSLENTVIEARSEYDSMKGKVELADAKSEIVLNMLKETAAFCSKDGSDVGVGDQQINGEETKVYAVELEVIKNAFMSKESKVENMKRQIESLQNSVDDAHKRKSFWTMLSSATTVLAAVSLAYVARGH